MIDPQIALVTVAALALLVLFLPRPDWFGLVATATVLLCIYAGTVELMGMPRIARIDLFPKDGEVLAYRLREGEAIFVWSQPAGGASPIAYRFPWSRKEAERLHDAARRQGQHGGTITMRHGTRDRDGNETPMFQYVQPAPPEPKGKS